MRAAILVLALFLGAGCAGPKGGDDGSAGQNGSTTSTGPASLPEGTPPFLDVRDNMELRITLEPTGVVHRVRMYAFGPFSVGDFQAEGENQGGGGGFGGGGAADPRPYGAALLPAGTPLAEGACADAAQTRAWDGRSRGADPNWDGVPAGVHDLWVWSSEATVLLLEFNGGGPNRANVTALAHNWTTQEVSGTLSNSGPAQTRVAFEETLTVPDGGGLFLGRFTLPSGYPDEEASTKVESGAVCAQAIRTGGGGGGGGGGGFGPESLSVAAQLPPGAATWSGTYTAATSPQGGGSATGLLLVPTAP